MAKTKAEGRQTPAETERDVKAGRLAPIYLLMGDEDYYIDRVSQLICETAVSPEERDFNLDTVYAPEVRAGDIVNIARQFPVMAERRVVLVKEFQSLSDKASLSPYVKRPLASTVLVLCHKHGMLDTHRAHLNEIRNAAGTVMERRRLYANQ